MIWKIYINKKPPTMSEASCKPEKGIEPLTCSLRVSCSTPELIWRAKKIIWKNRGTIKMPLHSGLKNYNQLIAACAAASLAIGTLYGEHET